MAIKTVTQDQANITLNIKSNPNINIQSVMQILTQLKNNILFKDHVGRPLNFLSTMLTGMIWEMWLRELKET